MVNMKDVYTMCVCVCGWVCGWVGGWVGRWLDAVNTLRASWRDEL